MRREILVQMTLISVLAFTGPSQAETWFGVGGMFGFGGEGEVEVDVGPTEVSSEDDFDATLGFHAWFDTTLSSLAHSGTWTQNLRFGGESRFLFWETEDQNDKSLTMEFCPTVKLLFPIKPEIDLFARFAPGFSVVVPSDDLEGFDASFGFNIALFGGGTYQLTPQFGLYAEMGFIFHDTFGSASVGNLEGDYQMSGAQFHLNFGLAF